MSEASSTFRTVANEVLFLRHEYLVRDNQPQIIARMKHAMIGVLLLVKRILGRGEPARISGDQFPQDKVYIPQLLRGVYLDGGLRPRSM